MKKLHINHESGFTLIEILVSVTLGLILLLGVWQIYLGNKTTYLLQEASANVQESGRFAMEFLTNDIRMAGYIGCANPSMVAVTNNVDPGNNGNADARTTVALFNGTNGIVGYYYDGTTFPAALGNYGLTAADVAGETDILYLQGARGCIGGDIVCHNNSSSTVKTCPGTIGNANSAEYRIENNNICQIAQNDIVMLSNCVTADIHAVTNNPNGSQYSTIAHSNSLNKSSNLSSSYGTGSTVYKVSAQVYYIGFNAAGQPALFRRSLSGNTILTEELVEGIYDMTIHYGENTDTDDAPNHYVDSANVTTWENVLSVRVTLHTRSAQDGVTELPTSYRYNMQDITDSRLIREFTSTVTLRNRVK